jgi:hypothetical protein
VDSSANRTYDRRQHARRPFLTGGPESAECQSTSQLVRHTRAFSEFRVRSAESSGLCSWESMTPGDHPAEEREAGILAPAIRSAATVRHS